MLRVLVTGSRTWDDPDTIEDALQSHGADAIVVGDARGADAIAVAWAEARGIPVEVHEADWLRHGRAAGPIRNKAMVATAPDLCLAFIRKGSRGATGCALLAEEAGIPTVRFR